MYAPKDDEFHRSEWRKRYPEVLSQKLRELVEASNSFSVKFVFTVSPGLSIVYSDPEETNLLIAKLQHVIDMGCKWVGILLDDIHTELPNDLDKRVFGSLAKAHSHLVNGVRDRLRKENGEIRVTFCPTYYANDYLGKKVSNNEYLNEVGAQMDPHVDILWTGTHVVSREITKNDASAFGKVIRRKPMLWDNYPVNDYFRDNDPPRLRLNFGPFRGRSSDLPQHLSGYLSNPMNESESSRVSLLTLADYLADPQKYSPEKSFERSIERLHSRERSYEAISAIICASKAGVLDPREVEKLRLTVKNLISSLEKKSEWEDEAESLQVQLTVYSKLIDSLHSGTANKKFLREIEPLVQKLKKLARLGIDCVDFLFDFDMNGFNEVLWSKVQNDVDEVSRDKTQILGQVDFGRMLDERKERDMLEQGITETELEFIEEHLSRMGLPKEQYDSPVWEFYEYLKKSRMRK